MDGMIIFIKGLFIGLMLCAPAGPIGMFCVRRTLAYASAAGMASWLGAATVDGLYAAVAGFGVTFISDFVMQEQSWLRHVGGLLLILLGLRIFLATPSSQDEMGEQKKGLVSAYASTFLFTMANPFPVVIFAALFAALGVGGWRGDYLATAVLVFGVFLGSSLWAPILVTVLRVVHPQLNSHQRKWLNHISGGVIAGFGVLLELINLIS